MKILIVLAHPDPASLNHAIAETVARAMQEAGHEVVLHDLCTQGFDPLLPKEEMPRTNQLPALVEEHCQDLASADGIVVVHPNWWGMPPAVMKGWIDRVFRPGLAYEFLEGDKGEGVPVGLLKARAALVFNTSNTSGERERNVFKDPLETLWKNCIFDLCGVREFHRRMFRIVVTSTVEEREAWLREAKETALRYFPPEK